MPSNYYYDPLTGRNDVVAGTEVQAEAQPRATVRLRFPLGLLTGFAGGCAAVFCLMLAAGRIIWLFHWQGFVDEWVVPVIRFWIYGYPRWLILGASLGAIILRLLLGQDRGQTKGASQLLPVLILITDIALLVVMLLVEITDPGPPDGIWF